MKEYIAKAVDGKNLTQEEAKKAMEDEHGRKKEVSVRR